MNVDLATDTVAIVKLRIRYLCNVSPEDQLIDVFNGHYPDNDPMTPHPPLKCEQQPSADGGGGDACDEMTLSEEDLEHLDTLVLSTAAPTPSKLSRLVSNAPAAALCSRHVCHAACETT